MTGIHGMIQKIFKTARHANPGEFRTPPWERQLGAFPQQLPEQRHLAAITREVLNADGMSLTVYVGGQSNVGIGVSGTWVGTVTFYASALADPLNFFLLSVTPFASGTNVNNTTANGNFFTAAKNYHSIKVVFTRTSGSVQVNVAPASDSTWQDAFLAQTSMFNSSASTGGVNTLTQAAQANRAWTLSFLETCFSGVYIGGAGRITIYDGTVAGNILYEEFIQPPSVAGSVGWTQKCNLPDGGITNTPGNAMTIVLRGFPAQATIINTKFSAG
jgi:hypothetical protein